MTNIYSLVSSENHIISISYDKQVLENMLTNLEGNYVIKENTKLYKLYNINGKYLITSKLNLEPNYSLHGFNKITTFGSEQVILDTSGISYDYLNTMNIFNNNISKNKITITV
jgi:hypothetical protein